jgi:WW domain-binding protein 4
VLIKRLCAEAKMMVRNSITVLMFSVTGTKATSNTTVKIKTKGVPSSLQVGKRKRPEKTQAISKEEEEALKAREAAKKRIQEREKGLMGLYQAY